MEANSLLSIVMPTYNRAEFLDYSLKVHIPKLKEYNIKIFISDNNSTDNTQSIVKNWMTDYEFLYYHKNESNIGPDANFETALKMPDTEYIWLFGDTYQIEMDTLVYLLNIIKNSSIDYDCFVFNLENIINYPTKDYTEQNELLINLSGIMSCVSCNVYNKKIIENASFLRYRNTFFSLEAIIFEYIDNKAFSIHWSQEQSVKNLNINNVRKKNWSNSPKMFEIGIEGWLKFIYSLPASYSLESKSKVEKLFANNSRLLSYRGLLIRRIDGAINMTLLISNFEKFIRVSSYTTFLYAFILCCIPKLVLKRILSLRKLLRKNT